MPRKRKYEEAVSDAIRLLDKKKRGWRKKINAATLNMDDYEQCILGQIYGECSDGLDKLDIGLNEYLAFGLPLYMDGMPQYDTWEQYRRYMNAQDATLKREWIRQING